MIVDPRLTSLAGRVPTQVVRRGGALAPPEQAALKDRLYEIRAMPTSAIRTSRRDKARTARLAGTERGVGAPASDGGGPGRSPV